MDPLELAKLKKRLDDLEAWKAEREKQQIVYPIDIQSLQVLGKYFMTITEVIDFQITGLGDRRVFTFIGKQDALSFQVSPQTIFRYTVTVSNDTLTLANGSNIPDDTAVYVYSDDTYPPPLAVDTVYYVVSSAGNTLKLSLTLGGAAINITGTGAGKQYLQTIITA